MKIVAQAIITIGFGLLVLILVISTASRLW